ncbi:MAG: hypothetical protein SH850_01990 [Planctomycetaceae bacterium]|nr:hypothetical protein [Planctomycetaceae bacterium]
MTAPTDPVDDRLAAIRRRVRRLVWWSGVSLSLTALFGGLIVAGGLDWLIRLDDVGLRVLLAVTVWTLVGATLWRSLWSPLRFGLSDGLVADQVDRRYPGLTGRSRSAAEFASAGCDPRWGSSELQALVIRQSREDLSRVEPADIVEPRRLGPLLCSAWLTCVVAAVLLFAYPLEAATAMRRLVWPWGHQPWPQATVLQLCDAAGQPLTWDAGDPLRAVRGETLKLLASSVRGRLPDQVWLETRLDPHATPEVSLLKQEFREVAEGTSEPIGIVEIPVARGPLEFRVTGGDDRSMPWYRLEVVEPPTIADLEIALVPPTYSGLPPQTLPVGVTQIRGLIGTQVTVAARSTKPLSGVSLAQRETTPTPLTVAADGVSFVGALTISKPGTAVFWFVLADRQGFREQQPLEFELRGEIDTVPEVLLSQPDSDRLVTPTAVVPLEIDIRDDRGLTELRLVWQRDESEPTVRGLAAWDDRPLQFEHSGEWSLANLDLTPGQRLVFRAEALDACDVGEPHIGKSPPRTLLIVSPDEKAADLAHRIGELLDDLGDATKQQARLEQQAAELATQLEAVGSLRGEDRDLLNRVQFDQRRLNAQLTDPQHGLAQRARRLRGEFPENGLTDPATEPQLEGIAGALEELAMTALPQIDQQLTQTAKLLDQTEQADPAAAQQALSAARRGQSEVLETLTERQAELAQWQDERELTGELQTLLDTQKKLNADTADVGSQTISRAPAELMPQQLAELQKLAARQRQQAERLGQFQQHLEQLAKRLEGDDPARAAEATEAAEQLQQQQLDALLRQAADDVAANRMGSAGPLQQQAEQALEKLQQTWNEQLPDDAEQLVERLQRLEAAAEQMAEQAEMLRKKSEEETLSADDRETLKKQAEELRRDTQRLERQLDRMRMRSAAESARKAAQELRQAEAAANDADDPEQLRKHAKEAEEALKELQNEVRKDRRQAEARLVQDELERIASKIESLKTRQDGVVAETIRLEDQRRESGRFTRGQLRSLQDLAAVERELSAIAGELRDQLATAVVAEAALAGVVRSLDCSAERLTERQTDAVTQRLEKDAAQRLARILAAWNRKPEEADPTESQGQPPGENEKPQEAGPPGEAIPLQVQLALLRELQADCLERTASLEQQRQPDGTLPVDLTPLATDLAVEQGELATLAQQLIELVSQSAQPAPAAPEKQP